MLILPLFALRLERPGVAPQPASRLSPARPNAAAGPFVPEVGATPFPGYRLERLRGRGGFATVWESTTPTGDTVALKFMSGGTGANSTARELRSLQAIQQVEHKNLLRTRDVWSMQDWIVIGMDLADASLLDLLELYADEFGRPIEAEKVLEYLYPIAEALDFLNARTHRIDGRVVGLQHGDIKPNNILLTGDLPQLADYGLATPTLGPLTPCPRHGTAEYCAPEVFHGGLSDRSDQYSLAITYYVLRTGGFPFPEPPPREQLKNYSRPDPDLSALPSAERPIVARALAVAPQARFPTCVEFVAQILATNKLCARSCEGGGRVKIEPATESMLLGRSKLFR